jgi:peptidoglycan hydrolase-like protein with peptidoglycan-binding domain
VTPEPAGRRRFWLPALLTAAVMTGAIMAIAVRGGARAPAATPPPPVSAATVVRTDLATTVLTSGSLGYEPARPVINQLAGTYTKLPATGHMIRRGGVLFRVDDQAVVLMTGRTPAWRPFELGMTPGPDVKELQGNLIALGYASGLLSEPTGQYDLATDDAVQRWQASICYPVSGQIAVGQVVFLPGPVLVGALSAAPGQQAAPGTQPYQATTPIREVTVPVTPIMPPVAVGERVSIVLPTQTRTPGTVTAIGLAPAPASGNRAAGQASSLLTVTPAHPWATGTGTAVQVQISLTVQSVRHVLAVPVSALVALEGGGYAVEMALPTGEHRLIRVLTGIFAGGMVQVSGNGLAPGTKVVVAQ